MKNGKKEPAQNAVELSPDALEAVTGGAWERKPDYESCPACGSKNLEVTQTYGTGVPIILGYSCMDCSWKVRY